MKWYSRVLLAAGMLALLVLSALALTPTVRGHKAALLIIDVQDCFLPGGSLEVPYGDQVVPVINDIRRDFGGQLSLVVLSQDWHCPDHVSFASQHPGTAVLSAINLTYNDQGQLCRGDHVSDTYAHAVDCRGTSGTRVVTQTLWPNHCIQNVTSGPTSAEFSPLLMHEPSDVVVQKGYKCGVDSYSAFYDNGGFRQTELDGLLKQHGIEMVVVTGLALDYCVFYTSMDAKKLGYKVLTVTDACRGVAKDTTAAALKTMENSGIELVKAADLEGALQDSSQAQDDPGSFSLMLLLGAGALVTAILLLRG